MIFFKQGFNGNYILMKKLKYMVDKYNKLAYTELSVMSLSLIWNQQHKKPNVQVSDTTGVD